MKVIQDFMEATDLGLALIDAQGMITYSNKALRIILIQYLGNDLIFSRKDLFESLGIPDFEDIGQDSIKARKGDLALRITRKRIQLEGSDFLMIQVQDLSGEAKQMRDLHRYTSDMLVRVRNKITPVQNALTLYLEYGTLVSIEEFRRLFGMSSVELWQLERWIDALRDMSILNTGHMEDQLEIDAYSINQIIEESCKEISHSFAHTQHLPFFEIQIENDFFVLADKRRVVRILSGILLNSLQHSPSGSKIIISCLSNENQVHLKIQDQGQGIAPQDQNRIFEYGFRASQQTTSADAGLGTDLWLARALLYRMGAGIQFESTTGKGTSFTINLPQAHG